MPTAARSSTAKSSRSSGAKSQSTSKAKTAAKRPKTPDAIALLKQDHREVEEMIASFEKARTGKQKGSIAQKICQALKVHTQIEEEIFYPAIRGEIEEEDLLDEAQVEHTSAKQLIAEIEAMQPGEELYDAKVKVLGEYVKHHVQEEEREMFPQVREAGVDLRMLADQLKTRKAELMTQMKTMTH